jgi:hypothetical protein
MDIELLKSDEYPNSAYMVFDIDVKEVFGSKGRIPVKLHVNGHVFRTSLAPMGGTHMAVFNRTMRETTGYAAGDRIHITLELDTEERKADITSDVSDALNLAGLWDRFGTYSYSHQKEVMDWINAAKRPETRQRRITKLCDVLRQGR